MSEDKKCVCMDKKEDVGLPTGPDLYMGGDGLPDWMQFTITCFMFGTISVR